MRTNGKPAKYYRNMSRHIRTDSRAASFSLGDTDASCVALLLNHSVFAIIRRHSSENAPGTSQL